MSLERRPNEEAWECAAFGILTHSECLEWHAELLSWALNALVWETRSPRYCMSYCTTAGDHHPLSLSSDIVP